MSDACWPMVLPGKSMHLEDGCRMRMQLEAQVARQAPTPVQPRRVDLSSKVLDINAV